MKILITGGAGFIGSHLTDHLIKDGNEVLVIDNFATGNLENLTPHKNLEVLKGTIANRKLVFESFKIFKPQLVIHAAASYKNPNDWVQDVRTNILGGSIITQAAIDQGVKRLIYFQTSLCYGISPLEQPITLKHPLQPGDSSYAISKTAAEQYIALSGLDFISFRLSNIYGPRNLSGPLPTFYQRLCQGLKCFVMDTRRDFIYIQDLIDIVIMAVNGKGKSGYYHVSSGMDYPIRELFDLTVKAMSIKLKEEVQVRERNPDDAYTILLDPSQTKRVFKWQPKVKLKKGVMSAVKWYKNHKIDQTFTHLKSLEINKN